MLEAGVHGMIRAGIHGSEVEGAYSIVLSDGYETDKDHGDVMCVRILISFNPSLMLIFPGVADGTLERVVKAM